MSELKYHISNNGEPRLCRASSLESCPKTKAGDEFHGTLEEATIESEERFKEEYGSEIKTLTQPKRSKDNLFSPYSKNSLYSEILEASDPKLQVEKGLAIIESDLDLAISKLNEAKRVEAIALVERNYAPEVPFPENYKALSSEEKILIETKLRAKSSFSKNKVRVLKSLYSKTPNELIKVMMDYHSGKTNEWPTSWNVGTNESEILKEIPKYSSDSFNRNQDLVEGIKSGSSNFSFSEMNKNKILKLSKILESRGLELKSAIEIEVDSKLKERQDEYSLKNGLRTGEGRELLFHGTSSHNIASIASIGLEYNAGVSKAGSANGRGFYLSDDASVASAFSNVREDNPGYLVLCEVVTGGPDRVQELSSKIDYRGRGATYKAPKTFGKTNGLKNLSRRNILSIEGKEDYSEVFVKDADQIVPVAFLKVQGKSKRIV